MAIDGRIRQVRRWGECIVIRIAPRVVDSKHKSNPGQRRLVILNPTYIPVRNQIIWGGADTCHIEAGFGQSQTQHYRRVGYTRIQEEKPRQQRRNE